MKNINWGIIGCGDVTELKSGPAFNKVPHSRLVAVMRRDAAKAKDYAERHGVPRWYNDASQLINDPEVNAVYIATPPSSHEAYAIAALQAGKPVYVEKPMSLNYQSALNMATAAADCNGLLTVAHYRRQWPLFIKLKQLLHENVIGEVRLVRLEFYAPPLSSGQLKIEKNAWRVDPAIPGGGLFHDLAPHQLDLMLYFFGAAKQVSGIATNQAAIYGADDLVTGNILFTNGIVFSGTWCFSAAAQRDHCEIVGSEGSISFSFFNGNYIQVNNRGETSSYQFEQLQHVQQPMIEQVVQYFGGEAPNPCTGKEGATVMRWMEAFTSSNKNDIYQQPC